MLLKNVSVNYAIAFIDFGNRLRIYEETMEIAICFIPLSLLMEFILS